MTLPLPPGDPPTTTAPWPSQDDRPQSGWLPLSRAGLCLMLLTWVLEGPTARRGTLMSNPPLGSFSPLKHGSLGGSRPPSQSQMVFRIACRTLGRKARGSDQVSPLAGGKQHKPVSRVCGVPAPPVKCAHPWPHSRKCRFKRQEVPSRNNLHFTPQVSLTPTGSLRTQL